MLPRQTIGIVLAVVALVAAGFPAGAASGADECRKGVDEADPDKGRLGRQCVTFTTDPTGDELTCVPFGTTNPNLDKHDICTYYLILVPFTDGGNPRAEIDLWVLYGETNGVQGLQTTGVTIDGQRPDQVLLVY